MNLKKTISLVLDHYTGKPHPETFTHCIRNGAFILVKNGTISTLDYYEFRAATEALISSRVPNFRRGQNYDNDILKELLLRLLNALEIPTFRIHFRKISGKWLGDQWPIDREKIAMHIKEVI